MAVLVSTRRIHSVYPRRHTENSTARIQLRVYVEEQGCEGRALRTAHPSWHVRVRTWGRHARYALGMLVSLSAAVLSPRGTFRASAHGCESRGYTLQSVSVCVLLYACCVQFLPASPCGEGACTCDMGYIATAHIRTAYEILKSQYCTVLSIIYSIRLSDSDLSV